jgi:hypothetical protein
MPAEMQPQSITRHTNPYHPRTLVEAQGRRITDYSTGAITVGR